MAYRNEGYDAAQSGLAFSENPYKPRTAAYTLWQQGYIDSIHERSVRPAMWQREAV